MSRNSPFLAAGRPMGSSTSCSSYRNDDDCYVADNLVKKLQRKRNSVIRLMNDAEEKQFTEPDIKKWLVSIKHTMYDANALLDKIDTEARFSEKYKEDGSRDEGFVQWATSEINRIIEELEGMVKKAANMGLKARDEGAAASAQQTRIPNDRSQARCWANLLLFMVGKRRKHGSWNRCFLHLLPLEISPTARGDRHCVKGGLGKTTLAQYLYNHADVERCLTRSRSLDCSSVWLLVCVAARLHYWLCLYCTIGYSAYGSLLHCFYLARYCTLGFIGWSALKVVVCTFGRLQP